MNVLKDRVSLWLATGLGVGMVAAAPGTVGGLWGIAVAWAVGQLSTVVAQCVAIALLLLLGVAVCQRAAIVLGGKDPQAIVLDEIVALPIVYLGVEKKCLAVWIGGWVLFRAFDIAKPPPVRQVERLPGAWGIMADDVVAAGYAWMVLHSLLWLSEICGWAS